MTRMPPPPRRQPPPPAYQQSAYPRGAYGADPYHENQGRYRKTGVDPMVILAGVLGGLAALCFVLVLVFWNLKAGTENRLSAKRTENNKLKTENHNIELSNGNLRKKLLLAGPEGYGLVAGSEDNQPPEGADYWKGKFEETAKLRDEWAMQAKYWDDQMSQKLRKWEQANAHISVPKESIRDEADAEGRLMVAFTVENRWKDKLTNLAGRLRFYQGGKLVAEEIFEVDAIDANSTRQMKVYVPAAVTGPYDVAGSIKATGY